MRTSCQSARDSTASTLDADRSPAAPGHDERASRTHPQRRQAIAVAQRIVALLNEVTAGVRPAHVVAPLFAAHLRGAIRRARPRPGPVPGVHRIAMSTTAEGVYEIVAVCRRGGTYDAVGLRLERNHDGWLVTDVARPAVARDRPPHLSDPPGDHSSPGDGHR